MHDQAAVAVVTWKTEQATGPRQREALVPDRVVIGDHPEPVDPRADLAIVAAHEPEFVLAGALGRALIPVRPERSAATRGHGAAAGTIGSTARQIVVEPGHDPAGLLEIPHRLRLGDRAGWIDKLQATIGHVGVIAAVERLVRDAAAMETAVVDALPQPLGPAYRASDLAVSPAKRDGCPHRSLDMRPEEADRLAQGAEISAPAVVAELSDVTGVGTLRRDLGIDGCDDMVHQIGGRFRGGVGDPTLAKALPGVVAPCEELDVAGRQRRRRGEQFSCEHLVDVAFHRFQGGGHGLRRPRRRQLRRCALRLARDVGQRIGVRRGPVDADGRRVHQFLVGVVISPGVVEGEPAHGADLQRDGRSAPREVEGKCDGAVDESVPMPRHARIDQYVGRAGAAAVTLAEFEAVHVQHEQLSGPLRSLRSPKLHREVVLGERVDPHRERHLAAVDILRHLGQQAAGRLPETTAADDLAVRRVEVVCGLGGRIAERKAIDRRRVAGCDADETSENGRQNDDAMHDPDAPDGYAQSRAWL